MAPPNNAQFGIRSGELQVGTGQVTLVDGLTTARYVYVKPLSTNGGDLLIHHKVGPDTGVGYRLEPTDPAQLVDLNYDNASIRISATTNGNTATWMLREHDLA